MNKKKHIAVVTSGYFPVPPVKGGAIEALIQELVEEYDVCDCCLTIFSMFDNGAEKKARDNNYKCIKYIKIPKLVRLIDVIIYYIFKNIVKKQKHMSYRYIVQRLFYINSVAKLIAENDYTDIVFENHPTLLHALDKYGNRNKYSGHTFYHAHNEIYNEFGQMNNLLEIKKYICVSDYIAKSIHDRYPDLGDDNFCVLRNRIDEKRFKNVKDEDICKFKKKYNISSEKMTFTFTGRLNPEKGIKELLLAFKKANNKNTQLIVAGSYFFGSKMKSKYELELREIARSIDEKVIFTGNIEYADMPLLYACSDVIVLPSIWNDPAPLTVIESLTSGKPLITTYSGGIPEYANENNSIILHVDDKLVDNICEAINSVATNEKLRANLRENAMNDSIGWTKKEYYNDFISIFNG